MFEKLIEKIKHKPKILNLFLLSQFLHVFGLSVYSLLFNLLLQQMGYREGTIGTLASTTSMGVALIAFPASFLMENFSSRRAMSGGLIVMAIGYVLQIYSHSVELKLIFGLFGSMGLALYNISVAPFLFKNIPPEDRVYAFSFNSATVMAAHFLGYLFGGYLPGLFAYFVPILTSQEQLILSIYLGLTLSLTSLFPLARLIVNHPAAYQKVRFWKNMKEKEWSMLLRLILPKICLALGAGMIVPFINLYLSQQFKFSPDQIGLSMAVLQLFTFVGILLGPFFTQKMHKVHFISLTSFLSVPFILMMAFLKSAVFVLVAFFCRGMLMNMGMPVLSLLEMEKVKPQECLFASAVISFSYNLSWTLSVSLGGLIIENYSFATSFTLASFFYLIPPLCYMLFFGLKSQTSSPKNILQDAKSAA
jgi:predicted MFS family arabinose efflux permease